MIVHGQHHTTIEMDDRTWIHQQIFREWCPALWHPVQNLVQYHKSLYDGILDIGNRAGGKTTVHQRVEKGRMLNMMPL